jgi:hypothetical protein
MINLVIGPSCIGKSYFIHSGSFDLGRFKVLDLLDYEIQYSKDPSKQLVDIQGATEGYAAIKRDMVELAKEKADVIVEHTLYKKKRREDVLSTIREVTEDEVNLYVLVVSEERIQMNRDKRRNSTARYAPSVSGTKLQYREIEPISEEEGFSHIYLVRDDVEKDDTWTVEEVSSCKPSDYFEWPETTIDLYEITKDVPNAQDENCFTLKHKITMAIHDAMEEYGDEVTIHFNERSSENKSMDIWVNSTAKSLLKLYNK